MQKKKNTLSDKLPKRTLSETSTTLQELQVGQFRNKFMIMLGYFLLELSFSSVNFRDLIKWKGWYSLFLFT